MQTHQHESCNFVLRPPAGSTPEECVPITGRQFSYPDGTPAIATWWTPSRAELVLLNSGMPLRLITLGNHFAPILVGVDGDGVL
jgi:hypothetical protein